MNSCRSGAPASSSGSFSSVLCSELLSRRSSRHAINIIDCTIDPAGGSVASMAVQRRLGLLPVGRARHDPGGRFDSVAPGPDLNERAFEFHTATASRHRYCEGNKMVLTVSFRQAFGILRRVRTNPDQSRRNLRLLGPTRKRSISLQSIYGGIPDWNQNP